jgi:uncharacterized RDD family membrane protein YckC
VSGRIALVATVNGNDDLCAPPVAVDGARQIAAVLASQEVGGFEVDLAVDPAPDELAFRVETLLSQRSETDLVLAIFTGPMAIDGSRCWLIAGGGAGGLPISRSIDVALLHEASLTSPCHNIVLVIDAYVTVWTEPGAKAGGSDHRALTDHFPETTGRYLLAATTRATDGRVGVTSDGDGGTFLAALCHALTNESTDRTGDGLISVEEWYEEAERRHRLSAPAADRWMSWSGRGGGSVHVGRTVSGPPVDRPSRPARFDERLKARAIDGAIHTATGFIVFLLTLVAFGGRGLEMFPSPGRDGATPVVSWDDEAPAQWRDADDPEIWPGGPDYYNRLDEIYRFPAEIEAVSFGGSILVTAFSELILLGIRGATVGKAALGLFVGLSSSPGRRWLQAALRTLPLMLLGGAVLISPLWQPARLVAFVIAGTVVWFSAISVAVSPSQRPLWDWLASTRVYHR